MTKRLVGLVAVAVAGVGLGLIGIACSSDGVSQSEHDRVKQQLQDKEAEASLLQQQVADLQKKASAPTTAATAAPADSKPAGLIAAVSVTPRPTNTPLPAGSTPPTAAPRETPPPAFYEKVDGFFVYAETLATTTASKYNVASNVSCTPSGVFARGQRMVWRYEILDVATGMRITDKDGATVKVVLPNGDESTGRFSQRGGGSVPGAPFMWSSNWDIPLDYPLGSVDYKITITTKDGRSATWKPPALATASGIDTRPKVMY